jgi:hypothetical protein
VHDLVPAHGSYVTGAPGDKRPRLDSREERRGSVAMGAPRVLDAHLRRQPALNGDAPVIQRLEGEGPERASNRRKRTFASFRQLNVTLASWWWRRAVRRLGSAAADSILVAV